MSITSLQYRDLVLLSERSAVASATGIPRIPSARTMLMSPSKQAQGALLFDSGLTIPGSLVCMRTVTMAQGELQGRSRSVDCAKRGMRTRFHKQNLQTRGTFPPGRDICIPVATRRDHADQPFKGRRNGARYQKNRSRISITSPGSIAASISVSNSVISPSAVLLIIALFFFAR